jgi:hypothetical protein
LLDQGFARRLGHARSDRQAFGDEAGIVHLVAVVDEVRPSAEDAVSDLLGERAPMQKVCSLLDALIEGIGVALESLAVFMLPARTRALGVALRMERLSDLADILGGMGKVDQCVAPGSSNCWPHRRRCPSTVPRGVAAWRVRSQGR